MPNSLAIIGAGRVGRSLGRRLRELGWRIGAVVTRSEPSARRTVRFIGDGKACAGMTRRILASRVILMATPDDEIAVVAQELARIGEEELRGRVVLHTSELWTPLCSMPCMSGARWADRCIRCNCSAESRCHRWKARFLRLKGKRTRSGWRGRSPEEFAQAYEALSHLAARVLAKDPAGVLAELEKTSVEKKPKAKAIGGKG
jgi:hypothetical protein